MVVVIETLRSTADPRREELGEERSHRRINAVSERAERKAQKEHGRVADGQERIQEVHDAA